MATKIRFAFVCEGSSDIGLISPLEKLCVLCGADEATGVAPDLGRLPDVGRTISAKVRVTLKLEPSVNLLFIHRDADTANPQSRYEEIHREVEAAGIEIIYVAVIPIQETEAWLLLDEQEIRRVAERPNGRLPLHLPNPKQVESISSPKERLDEVLILASELRGRRLEKFRKTLSKRKRLLLEQLDPTGAICQLSAWQQLEHDLLQALDRLRGR